MIRTEMDALAATLARIFIGGFFALSGANNLLDIPLAAKNAAEIGIPAAPVVIIAIALIKLILGVMIMIRYHTKLSALILIVYTTASSLIFYNPYVWAAHEQSEAIFMRNIAILGGLLFLYAHSRGVKLLRGTPEEDHTDV